MIVTTDGIHFYTNMRAMCVCKISHDSKNSQCLYHTQIKKVK